MLVPNGYAMDLGSSATGPHSLPKAPLLAPWIDFSGVISAINGNGQSNTSALNDTKTTLNNTMIGLPFDIVGLFTNSIKNSVRSFNSALLGLTGALLAGNPDPQLMYGVWQSIIFVISSLYLIIFLIVGFGFFFSGANIQKREEAKERLKKTVFMIIGVNVSFVIYQLALELSTAITQFMWTTGFEQFFSNSIFSGLGFAMLFVYASSLFITIITLFLRYLFLLVGVVIFPIGVFLYFAPKMRSWGKLIFEFLGMMLAMQLVDVIVLIAVGQVMLALSGTAGSVLVPALGFIVIAFVNGFMIIHSIMKSANAVADSTPIIGIAIGALSGQVGALASVIKPAPKTNGGN
ncbi:Uncharacterised protein [uncultured archaeon]|nr:Uncharacterised protein [uncultured archaeon]